MKQEKMHIGDLAFLAYVKKLVPNHPTTVHSFPKLIVCQLCGGKYPARTECGACDLCLRSMRRDGEI